MKIGIPSQDKTHVSENFGRANYFAIYDTEKKGFEFIDNNTNVQAAQGAGIQSASSLVKLGVEVIVSPHIGPKAFDVLRTSGVKAFLLTENNCLLERAVEQYTNGALASMEGPHK